MIKVCPFEDKWHDSINFVDDNNRFVGYEYSSQCCEQFGYLFCRFNSQEDADRFDNNGDNCFDIHETYFKDTVIVDNPDLSNAFFSKEQPLMEYGKFRIEGCDECNWLVLYNYHNGYYRHGFVYKDGDKTLCDEEM